MGKLFSVLVTICTLFISVSTYSATIDFESLPPGTLVTSLGDVTFSTNIEGYSLVVSDVFDATSGENYLGVDDGGLEVFFPGDVVMLDFAVPVSSISVSFISSPDTPRGIFVIDTPSGMSTSGATPDNVLSDSGEIFTVSFQSATPFVSAQLFADLSLGDGSGIISFNIDDITFILVPIPSALLLLSCGLCSIIASRKGLGKE